MRRRRPPAAGLSVIGPRCGHHGGRLAQALPRKPITLVPTDHRVTPTGHKAFVTSEIDRLRPVIEASGRFAD